MSSESRVQSGDVEWRLDVERMSEQQVCVRVVAGGGVGAATREGERDF